MSKPWTGLAASLLALLAASVSGAGCTTADLKGAPTSSSSSGTTGVDPGDDGSSGTSGGTIVIPGGVDPATIPVSSGVTIQIQPSDLGAQIEASIRAAQTSVHMTMYLLTSNAIIDALGDLHDAGKDVKVVLNQTFPTTDGADNASSYAALQARKVPVVWAPAGYTFTHAKTVIIDANKVLVMTMNLTFTSPKENREFIATDTDADDVAATEKIFAADYTGAAVSTDSKLIISPNDAQPVNPENRIKSLILSARTSLDVEVQSLADTGLTDAIILAHQSNITVRVVISGDLSRTDAEKTAIMKLNAAGVPLKGVNTPYIHAKAIVVDGTRVFVGSQNFTSTALFQNREVGVVTDSATESKKVTDVIGADFAAGAAVANQ